MRAEQKNFTISEEQREFLKANHGKINNGELAKMLGLSYNKTYNNLKLMKLVTTRKQGKIVDFDTYFDYETFFKQYQY